jgi:hypothetical protein
LTVKAIAAPWLKSVYEGPRRIASRTRLAG